MSEKIPWTSRQIALVRSMRAAGYTNEEIRQKLGGVVSIKRLLNMIREEGIPPRPRQGGYRSPVLRRYRLRGPTLPPLPSLMNE